VNAEAPVSALKTVKLTKRFAGMTAVDQVDLTIHQGEIHGIIGRNGAGKSVLVSMIAGVVRPTSGDLVIGKARVAPGGYSPGVAHAAGIALIPQEPQFAAEMSVLDNLFLGAAPRRGPLLALNQMRAAALDAIAAVGVRVSPRSRMGNCTIEEQQLLAVAKAIFVEDAKVILLDEITASLSAVRKQQILDLMRSQARDQSRSFVLISHRVAEVMSVCDAVSVLRDGQRVATLKTAETTQAHLADLIVGGAAIRPEHLDERELGEEVLAVEGISQRGKLQDTSFKLRRGEILGLAGLDGSGKEEVMRALYGLEKLTGGAVRVRGKAARIRSPKTAGKLGIAYLPKERDELAIIHHMSVLDNILLPVYTKVMTPFGLINRRAARELVRERMQALPFKAASVRAPIDSLSGGNQQRVVLNRVALLKPDIFVLGEPTRGVDIASKPAIIATVRNSLSQDAGVVLSSESEDELIDMCDRVLVFFRGECVREFRKGEDDFNTAAIYNAIQGVD
jgi:ABC-type sugar transport system ATPase subunit